MNTQHPHAFHDDSHHQGSTGTYFVGFILSILLTLASYYIVAEEAFGNRWILISVVSLAVIQVLVQLFFFLHLGRESKPHWNLLVFLFMVLVIVIVVFGSLWIMFHLDERMMGEMEMENHMKKERILK